MLRNLFLPWMVLALTAGMAAGAQAVEAAVVADWDARLQELLRARLELGEPPRFALAGQRMTFTLESLDADGGMKLSGQGVRMGYTWKRLKPLDRRNLAEAVREEDEPGHAALVAFYALLGGEVAAAQKDLARAGAAAEPLRELFAANVAEPETKQSTGAEEEDEETKKQGSAAAGSAYQGPYGFRRDGSGRFPEVEPPLSWDAETDRNIVWSTAMPAKSNCSPALSAEHVFVCAEPHTLLCVDRATGDILWQRTHSFAEIFDDPDADANLPQPRWHGYMGYTTPTPVAHEGHVWAVFGHGMVVCYTAGGERVWAKRFEAHNRVDGIAASPVLVDGQLIFYGKGRPRVNALDASNGDWLWGSGGSGDGTPRVVRGATGTLLVHSGGVITDCKGTKIHSGLLGGHYQGGDGGGRPENWGATPAIGDGLAVFHVHFKPGMIKTALRAVDLTTGKQVWEFYTNTGDSNHDRMGRSHLLDEGLVYAIRDYGHMHVVDATTGDLVYEQPGMGKSYVSTTRAGPVIFHLTKREAVIFRPGRSYQEVARFKHGFRTHIPSPIFAGRQMFYRGYDKLWCIGH